MNDIPESFFEERWSFKRVPGGEIAPALARIGKLLDFEPPTIEDCCDSLLYRSALPARSELLVPSLREFLVIASKSGSTEATLPRLAPLSTHLKLSWAEHFAKETIRVSAELKGERWSLQFENFSVSAHAGWSFLEQVAKVAELPAVWSGRDATSVAHSAGLQARSLPSSYDGLRHVPMGPPRGLWFELEENDPARLLGYFRDIGAAIGTGVESTLWSASPLENISGDEAYGVLHRGKLPAKRLIVDWTFLPGPPELTASLHALCTKSQDEITVPLGSFAALPAVRSMLELEIKKKGCQLWLVLDQELEGADVNRILTQISEVTGLTAGK